MVKYVRKVEFTEAGTTHPKSVYFDEDCTKPSPNPVIANLEGEFPKIYLQDRADTYRVKAFDEWGNLIYVLDPLNRSISWAWLFEMAFKKLRRD